MFVCTTITKQYFNNRLSSMDPDEIYTELPIEDAKQHKMKKKYPVSEYVSKKRQEFYMKNVAKEKENTRSFKDVFKESVNISNEDNKIKELQTKEINKEVVQKKKYKKKRTLALNQSRKKNRKYVNALKNCNPQIYANAFAESDEGRNRSEEAKKYKENSCSFKMNKDEKVTQVTEADWPSREIERCKKCGSNMYNCRNSEVQ